MENQSEELATESTELSPEQVKNWRNAMFGMLGGYALIMPVEQIQQLRDKMQEWANAPEREAET